MTRQKQKGIKTGYSRTLKTLIATFIITAICELFFLLDVVADYFYLNINTTWLSHNELEFIVTITLGFTLVAIAYQIVQLNTQNKAAKKSLKVASGALAEVISSQFQSWQLSPSEIEVGFLIIKGLSLANIAELRNTKQGTVKSQASAIYQKAGVGNRHELISFFIEDLLSVSLINGVNHVPKV